MNIYIENNGKKYPAPKTEKELTRVARLWRRNAQAKLRRDKVNSSGVLKSSMKTKLGMNQNQPYADITPNVDYWEFIDLGVRGAKFNPFKRQTQSPFKFTNKKPPIKAIMNWMKDKPVKGRGADGKFITQESAAFLIQNAIWKRGIKPIFFLSDTGKRIEAKYSESIAEAYAMDLESFIAQSLKE